MSFHVDLISVGKLKQNSPFYTLFDDYSRRLSGKFNLIELEGKSQADEHAKILTKLTPSAAIIALDEKGKSLPSKKFAAKLEELQHIKGGKIQFIIGGADGLNDEIRNRADLLLSFGTQTWPHMLARVMLVEQIYRAQQILVNHPYHRE